MPPQKLMRLRQPESAEPRSFLAKTPRPLEDLLVSGGDARLVLAPHDQRNSYGCTPFPRPEIVDFSSTTASSISSRAFDQAMAANARLWMESALNPNAFDGRVEALRDALRAHLGLAETEIVFSPSGTDAQLQALFLVRAILGTPLVTIIAGADQTGSGTAHTSRGDHFSDRTALGVAVQKGTPIAGLSEDVRSVGVPFCDATGRLRSDFDMDAAVYAAVADAVSRGEKVLLQAMDSSKLGWSGPSPACLQCIAAAWPNQVMVVMDACQMRLGLPQLRDYLARNYLVLVTGSKFFAGPAFSGALLVPEGLAREIDKITACPRGLQSYATRYDWPRRWYSLREAFPDLPNHGQWLRWEATLAEMSAYFAVPSAFRHCLMEEFAARVSMLLVASGNLCLLNEHCGAIDQQFSEEMAHRTIFSFVPCHRGKPLPLPDVAAVYRAMGRNLSSRLPPDASECDRGIAARICQIGQPVALGHRPGAVLRISMSARLVSSCWDTSPMVAEALEPILENVKTVLQKLDFLIARPELLESETS